MVATEGERVDYVYTALFIYGVLALLVILIYMPKLAQFLYMFKKPEHKIATEKRRLSLVVAARNESGVIEDLLKSIDEQTYDKDFFALNVIVKDEDDPTIEIAKRHGAKVFIVPNQTCKGEALDGYFKQEDRDRFDTFDAFVIIDADGVLEKNYLEELNNALEHDRDVFVTKKNIKNYLSGKKEDRSVFCNASALTYAQLDELSNSYRTLKGIPMNMCGQGMMIRRHVIEEIGGWPYRTLTEDYELRMDCFLKGFTSMFYPYAVIYTEEPLKHRDCYERRTRWVTGFSQCDRRYKKQIGQQARERGYLKEGEFEYFFSLVPLIAFIVVTILAIFVGVAMAIYFGLHSQPWLSSLLLLVVLPLGVIYVLMMIYGILCMAASQSAMKYLTAGEKTALVFFAPVFILEYFPIYIRSLILSREDHEWTVAPHVVRTEEDEEEEEKKKA